RLAAQMTARLTNSRFWRTSEGSDGSNSTSLVAWTRSTAKLSLPPSSASYTRATFGTLVSMPGGGTAGSSMDPHDNACPPDSVREHEALTLGGGLGRVRRRGQQRGDLLGAGVAEVRAGCERRGHVIASLAQCHVRAEQCPVRRARLTLVVRETDAARVHRAATADHPVELDVGVAGDDHPLVDPGGERGHPGR